MGLAMQAANTVDNIRALGNYLGLNTSGAPTGSSSTSANLAQSGYGYIPPGYNPLGLGLVGNGVYMSSPGASASPEETIQNVQSVTGLVQSG